MLLFSILYTHIFLFNNYLSHCSLNILVIPMTSQYYLYSWVSECYILLPKFNYYRDPYSLKNNGSIYRKFERTNAYRIMHLKYVFSMVFVYLKIIFQCVYFIPNFLKVFRNSNNYTTLIIIPNGVCKIKCL